MKSVSIILIALCTVVSSFGRTNINLSRNINPDIGGITSKKEHQANLALNPDPKFNIGTSTNHRSGHSTTTSFKFGNTNLGTNIGGGTNLASYSKTHRYESKLGIPNLRTVHVSSNIAATPNLKLKSNVGGNTNLDLSHTRRAFLPNLKTSRSGQSFKNTMQMNHHRNIYSTSRRNLGVGTNLESNLGIPALGRSRSFVYNGGKPKLHIKNNIGVERASLANLKVDKVGNSLKAPFKSHNDIDLSNTRRTILPNLNIDGLEDVLKKPHDLHNIYDKLGKSLGMETDLGSLNNHLINFMSKFGLTNLGSLKNIIASLGLNNIGAESKSDLSNTRRAFSPNLNIGSSGLNKHLNKIKPNDGNAFDDFIGHNIKPNLKFGAASFGANKPNFKSNRGLPNNNINELKNLFGTPGRRFLANLEVRDNTEADHLHKFDGSKPIHEHDFEFENSNSHNIFNANENLDPNSNNIQSDYYEIVNSDPIETKLISEYKHNADVSPEQEKIHFITTSNFGSNSDLFKPEDSASNLDLVANQYNLNSGSLHDTSNPLLASTSYHDHSGTSSPDPYHICQQFIAPTESYVHRPNIIEDPDSHVNLDYEIIPTNILKENHVVPNIEHIEFKTIPDLQQTLTDNNFDPEIENILVTSEFAEPHPSEIITHNDVLNHNSPNLNPDHEEEYIPENILTIIPKLKLESEDLHFIESPPEQSIIPNIEYLQIPEDNEKDLHPTLDLDTNENIYPAAVIPVNNLYENEDLISPDTYIPEDIYLNVETEHVPENNMNDKVKFDNRNDNFETEPKPNLEHEISSNSASPNEALLLELILDKIEPKETENYVDASTNFNPNEDLNIPSPDKMIISSNVNSNPDNIFTAHSDIEPGSLLHSIMENPTLNKAYQLMKYNCPSALNIALTTGIDDFPGPISRSKTNNINTETLIPSESNNLHHTNYPLHYNNYDIDLTPWVHETPKTEIKSLPYKNINYLPNSDESLKYEDIGQYENPVHYTPEELRKYFYLPTSVVTENKMPFTTGNKIDANSFDSASKFMYPIQYKSSPTIKYTIPVTGSSSHINNNLYSQMSNPPIQVLSVHNPHQI